MGGTSPGSRSKRFSKQRKHGSESTFISVAFVSHNMFHRSILLGFFRVFGYNGEGSGAKKTNCRGGCPLVARRYASFSFHVCNDG